MFDGQNIRSLTYAGVLFLVYLFIMVVVFMVLSPFVDSFFDTYNELEAGEATDEIAFFGPLYHTAIKIVLAGGIAIAPAWFIGWVFNREPAQYRRRYY